MRLLRLMTAVSAAWLSACGGDLGAAAPSFEMPEPDGALRAVDQHVMVEAARTLHLHCERRGAARPSAREARRAVGAIVSALNTTNDGWYEDQLEPRRFVAGVARHLETERCLPAQVGRLDRALRELALPDVETEVEEPVPYEDDYEGSWR